MDADSVGRALHDRATRGEDLNPDEQGQLDAWYAVQDAKEMERLSMVPADGGARAIQGAIDGSLAEIAAVARRIRETSAENESLRRQNAALRRRLALQRAPKAA